MAARFIKLHRHPFREIKMQDGVWKKALYYLVLAGFLSIVTAAAYFAFARFLRDRQTVVAELSRPPVDARRTRLGSRRETAAERAQRQAQTAGQAQVSGPAAAAAGEAAIQRQLKTLEEINRINEMNRRLQEQQRRMQNQH